MSDDTAVFSSSSEMPPYSSHSYTVVHETQEGGNDAVNGCTARADSSRGGSYRHHARTLTAIETAWPEGNSLSFPSTLLSVLSSVSWPSPGIVDEPASDPVASLVSYEWLKLTTMSSMPTGKAVLRDLHVHCVPKRVEMEPLRARHVARCAELSGAEHGHPISTVSIHTVVSATMPGRLTVTPAASTGTHSGSE